MCLADHRTCRFHGFKDPIGSVQPSSIRILWAAADCETGVAVPSHGGRTGEESKTESNQPIRLKAKTVIVHLAIGPVQTDRPVEQQATLFQPPVASVHRGDCSSVGG